MFLPRAAGVRILLGVLRKEAEMKTDKYGFARPDNKRDLLEIIRDVALILLCLIVIASVFTDKF